MAEKIKIVDLDLNTDLVMHKAVKVKEQINEISKEIKFLKDSQKEAQANIEKYTEELETMKQTGSGQRPANTNCPKCAVLVER